MDFDNNKRNLRTAEDLFEFLSTLTAEQRKNLPLQLMVSDDELHEGVFSVSAFNHTDEAIRGLRIETEV